MTAAPETSETATSDATLRLHPIRGLRPLGDAQRIGRLLCPPYDVIDVAMRERLLAADPDNAVAVILPEPSPAGYADAAARLTDLEARGVYALDDQPALYVYEMRTPDGSATRGLLGAVALRDPDEGVILPHENTMAGPVADRLEVMTATGADLEPIYLVYDGGGAASAAVRDVEAAAPVSEAVTPDGVTHRLWQIVDRSVWATIEADLAPRHALIADGHHRYATYRERQRRDGAANGPGPWDRGLTLLVDSSDYGPQVHAIHRVIPGLTLADALARLDGVAQTEVTSVAEGLAEAAGREGFAAVLAAAGSAYLITDPQGRLAEAAARADDLEALSSLDVTIMHRGLVEKVWNLTDDVDTVAYAHSIEDALAHADASDGIAVLLRPTPVAAVAAVAAAGGRMPRKSTLFTPKPASGLVMRRLADEQ